MGQILSIPMIIIGAGMFYYAHKNHLIITGDMTSNPE
jgi:prolipoprotein diacylglyceryltransferase